MGQGSLSRGLNQIIRSGGPYLGNLEAARTLLTRAAGARSLSVVRPFL